MNEPLHCNNDFLDFVVIGAAKCGTTTLHALLTSSPFISLPQQKDFHFFDCDENYQKGCKWYRQHFSRSLDGLVGEVAANYFYSAQAKERIILYGKENLKAIVILRNPVDRAISEYLHHRHNGTLDNELDYYLNNPNSPPEHGLRHTPWDLIIERSQYSKWITMWRQGIHQENFLILDIHELNDIPSFENKVGNFLFNHRINITNVASQNKAFIPKSIFLNGLLINDNLLKKLLRTIIRSYPVRKSIKLFIKKINSGSCDKDIEVSLDAKAYLSTILAPDTKFYEKVTNNK